MPRPDYHAILRVRLGASEGEIRASYRRLVRECHPDTHPDDTSAGERLKLINEAYEALTKGPPRPSDGAPDRHYSRPSYAAPYRTARPRRPSPATRRAPGEPFAYRYASSDFDDLFALLDDLIDELDVGIFREWRRVRRWFDF